MTATPEKVPKIYKAMLTILESLKELPKDQKTEAGGGLQSYSYRGIDSLLNALHPILVKAKVMILPALVGEPILHYRDTRGLPFRVTITVQYTFLSLEDGSSVVVGPVLAEGADSTDKSGGKAHSAAFKIAMYQAFAVAVAGGSIDPESGEQDYPVDSYGQPIEQQPATKRPRTEPIPPGAPATAGAMRTPPPAGTPAAAQSPAQRPPASQKAPPAVTPNPPRGQAGHLKSAGELEELHKMLLSMAGGSEAIACQLLKKNTQFNGTNKETGQPELVFRDQFNGQYLSGAWLFKTLVKVRAEYQTHLQKGGKPA